MLNRLKQFSFFANFLLLLITLTGCLKTSANGVSTGAVTWVTTTADPVPGIHEGTVNVVTLKHGPPQGVKLVFWGDRSSGKSHGSGSATGASAEGELLEAGQPLAKFRCETKNGTDATITIEGQTFDSKDGSLFLISTQDDKPQVKQLKIDVNKFPTQTQQIQQYPEDHPEVKEFFTAAHRQAAANPPEHR
ncbi:hypothetical protein ETAA8_26680 [Anatilimnocola aggregata]|uniref:Lipoprotein n=1 Tax=Anatilimnocola aggregata TaxID=2528021 RepID=A0A517YBF0_9BACT|nr:hypothetical protein [Anatilimnocola aggregata]QDU27580.1 hypothetical protein ETAA8_26680 [Anatilimnocola aggregata]